MSTSSTTAAKDVDWTIRGLLRRHKRAALGAAAVLAVMFATILVAALNAQGRAVSDATTCSQWGSANQDQQTAYARLYIREHGPLRGSGSSPTSVITAINNGCAQAYGDDVSDTTTLVQAISGKF